MNVGGVHFAWDSYVPVGSPFWYLSQLFKVQGRSSLHNSIAFPCYLFYKARSLVKENFSFLCFWESYASSYKYSPSLVFNFIAIYLFPMCYHNFHVYFFLICVAYTFFIFIIRKDIGAYCSRIIETDSSMMNC